MDELLQALEEMPIAQAIRESDWMFPTFESIHDNARMTDPKVLAVRKLVEWAHQGPRTARVSGVKVRGVDADEILHRFEIRPTE